ncbi:MAG: hypothetical protein NT125_07745 [Candidatus Bipolaricaulota bacterium]|nr:hypothetical protein [Candidatus Bipolaricaulota bacterium]
MLGLLIGVSLVAVGSAASAYSPSIARLFLSNGNTWFVVFVYGCSISYDFVVMGLATERLGPWHLVVGYTLLSWSILVLYPYAGWVLSLLSPVALVRMLLGRLSKDGIWLRPQAEEALEDAGDTVRACGLRGQQSTCLAALREIRKALGRIINATPPAARSPMDVGPVLLMRSLHSLTQRFLSQVAELPEAGRRRLSRECVDTVQEIARASTARGLDAEDLAVDALGNIASHCFEQRWGEETLAAVNAMAAVWSDYCSHRSRLADTGKFDHQPLVLSRAVFHQGALLLRLALHDGNLHVAGAGLMLVRQVCVDCARPGYAKSLLPLAQALDELALPVLLETYALSESDELTFWVRYFLALSAIGSSASRAGLWLQFRSVVDTALQLGLMGVVLRHRHCSVYAAKSLADLVAESEPAVRHVESRRSERSLWLHGLSPSSEQYDEFFALYDTQRQRPPSQPAEDTVS